MYRSFCYDFLLIPTIEASNGKRPFRCHDAQGSRVDDG